MHKYIGFYKNEQFECESDTTYHAQQKMAKEHGIKKEWQISVYLADEDTVHSGDEL